jgi:hypothetical protein
LKKWKCRVWRAIKNQNNGFIPLLFVLAQTICSAFANVKFSEPKFAEHDASLPLAARQPSYQKPTSPATIPANAPTTTSFTQ